MRAPSLPRVFGWLLPLAALSFAALSLAACDSRPAPGVPADRSALRAATDVFWALQKMGFIASKEPPQEPSRGCMPSEYQALKADPERGEARFKISVFECPDEETARAIVEDPRTRQVDSLLRNDHSGGILQRTRLQIIVRRTQGPGQAADELIRALEGM